MIDFRILTFLELCEQRNYTKTARRLNITQPTVTQHIQFLEQQYGVKLFQYEGKKLHLTKEGLLLMKAAQTIQTDSLKAVTKIKELSEQRSCLKIGATLTIGEFVLPEAMKDYILDHPDMELQITIGNTTSLLEELKQGKIDMAFVEGYFEKEEYGYELLMNDEFIGICSKDIERTQHLEFLDVFKETVLLREQGSGSREVFDRILYEKGYSTDCFMKKIIVSNINIIKYMVEQQVGISFVYKSAVKKELEEGRLKQLKIEDCYTTHEYNFVFLKDSFFEKEYQEFFQYVKKIFL